MQPTLSEVQPICVDPARMTKITVCTRPFRGQGPRIEAERLGDKLLVHNYGHGGSGWSLSWGSAATVVPLALAGGVGEVAVIGCGALGLTSAIALQRAGARVTIYARDLPPETRSARATGTWTPDARVALRDVMDAEFAERWERMARISFAAYQELLRVPGQPVEVHDRFLLSELVPEEAWSEKVGKDPIGFARLEYRLADLYAAPVDFGPGMHPFGTKYCRQTAAYRFNIAEYSRHLEREFRERGGEIVRAEFRAPADLLQLHQPVIVHCTGYGARALFGDETLIPVRGQITWLPPMPELPYSLIWGDLNLVPRADGTVVQWGAQGDGTGWQDATELPDMAEAQSALALASSLCDRMLPLPRAAGES